MYNKVKTSSFVKATVAPLYRATWEVILMDISCDTNRSELR